MNLLYKKPQKPYQLDLAPWQQIFLLSVTKFILSSIAAERHDGSLKILVRAEVGCGTNHLLWLISYKWQNMDKQAFKDRNERTEEGHMGNSFKDKQ